MLKAPNSRLSLIVGLAATLACQACTRDKSSGTCYLELTRESPGKLTLSGPVSCSEPASRYRLQGRPERPEKIDHLDPDGASRLSYQVSYDPQGRPVGEERVYHLKPAAYKLYGGRSMVEFSGRAPGKWEVVRILTEVDSRGRPTKTRKYLGSELQYSVVSEYEKNRLKSRSTYDGNQQLLNRISYFEKNGRPFERMQDSDGKVLMEREVAQKEPKVEQDLDTSGRGPVHRPIPSD